MANEVHEFYTYKQCQTCQKTFATNDLLQQHLESYRSEERDLLARLAACRAHIAPQQPEGIEQDESNKFVQAYECHVDQGIEVNIAGSSLTCPVSVCPRHIKKFPKSRDLLRHYCRHISCQEVCPSCSKPFDRVSSFIRHESKCDVERSFEAREHYKALVKGLEENARHALARKVAVRSSAVETVMALLPKRPLEAVNSISDKPQPFKKARVDLDSSAEIFIVNSGQEAVSTSPDMRQPFEKAEEPPQGAQVDLGELSEAFISNSGQEDTIAKSSSLYRLNVEKAGRPVSEPLSLSLESTRGSPSDYFPPAPFQMPASAPTLKIPFPSLTNANPISKLPALASPSSGAQERSSVATVPPACVARGLPQPPTPRPEPSPLSFINHPVVQTTPMHPNLPVNQTASIMKESLKWGKLFTRQNFGPMEESILENSVVAESVLAHGILKEFSHQNQPRMTVEDIPELRKEGFVHWKDQLIGSSIGLMSRSATSTFWSSDGWEILTSILTNPRVRRILSEWFKGPCLIAHWMRWGKISTESAPTFLARNAVESLANSEFDIPYLGLHVMCEATGVRCFARSHRKFWSPITGQWFHNSWEALQAHKTSEELSNGFIVFDPRTNFHIEKGSAMSIVFGTRDSVSTWTPLRVTDPFMKEVFETMEAAGVGFNFEFVEE